MHTRENFYQRATLKSWVGPGDEAANVNVNMNANVNVNTKTNMNVNVNTNVNVNGHPRLPQTPKGVQTQL